MYKILAFLLLFATSTLSICGQQNWNLPKIAATSFRSTIFNITRYGAVGDGHQLNTTAIQKAIDECHAKGGGIVQVPAGLWLTGPIVLKSNVNLNLSTGATLLFTKDKSQYPLVKANWEGFEQMRNQSPISAEGATNIGITGKGIIDGNGDGWRAVKKGKMTEGQWKELLASGGVLNEAKDIWMPSESFAKGQSMKDAGRLSADKDAAFLSR
ncbi:glycoside hydrolase family 28 protein [Niabella ginsengisoli]|uniref:Rhamnogalacturonase A/B/Epimerase-like pectate lyase domain-containing protein n=1 Tax=Niabella ginsengisoli TaxID=522298 RepID=A0ABS9SQR4_9BACT|nr:glycosyl hydrolase family 28-related protein [Niabella ginsengisoli]MCH5600717.1 hypothetical protein [Niabella ginsengisoli]